MYHDVHRGYYKNFWCDSGWQLALVLYCLDHNIQIVRNTKVFPYKFGRKILGYKPDFIMNGVYVQVKGLKDYRSKRKIEQFPYPLKVFGAREMKPYLKYVIQKYGKDYYKLLETKNG